MPDTLPPDASFRDVVLTLPDARRYFASVYQIMRKSEQDHGACFARIGVKGTGVMPNFRIENEDGTIKKAYDGVRFIPFTEPRTHDPNWSSHATSTNEMKNLAEEQAATRKTNSL